MRFSFGCPHTRTRTDAKVPKPPAGGCDASMPPHHRPRFQTHQQPKMPIWTHRGTTRIRLARTLLRLPEPTIDLSRAKIHTVPTTISMTAPETTALNPIAAARSPRPRLTIARVPPHKMHGSPVITANGHQPNCVRSGAMSTLRVCPIHHLLHQFAMLTDVGIGSNRCGWNGTRYGLSFSSMR